MCRLYFVQRIRVALREVSFTSLCAKLTFDNIKSPFALHSGGSSLRYKPPLNPAEACLKRPLLHRMSYDCRLCGIGKLYCQCGPNSFLDMNSDGEHVTDDEEEWEPDLGWLEEDEKQNEGLQTPNKGERSTLQSVSPENATVDEQAAGRRLFGLKRK